MECLRDYIGIRWCGNTTVPPSSYYINDLAGLSLKQIVSLTDEESATFISLWNTIQQRGESRFSVDVRNALSSRYKVSSLLQGINLGKEVGVISAPDGSAFHGFAIEMMDSAFLEYSPSPLASIHVQQLSFYCAAADNTEVAEVAIFDMLTGTKLYTTSVTLATGWNTIEVNTTLINTLTTPVWNVFCGINATNLSTHYLQKPLNAVGTGCCKSRIRGAYTASTTGITQDSLTYTDSTYGMSGIYTVKCLWDSFVCQNKNLFARAYWYCLGIELLTEQIYSNNLNSYTTINLTKAKELRDEYIIEYNKALEQTANNMHLDCDCCVECSGSVQLTESNSFW